MNKSIHLILILSAVLVSGCNNAAREVNPELFHIDINQGISLLGDTLKSVQLNPISDSSRIAEYLVAEKNYKNSPDNPDALIWMGRRMAYLGDYKSSVEIYSKGIKKFPSDARMYRHRGHRYITLRQFEMAITDLEKAAELIAGSEDEVEQDGIPNSRNIPVSTTHGNIWYHLGLAYYLVNDMENALYGFNECLVVSNNPDMQVAAAYWVYMVLRRMDKSGEAEKILNPITADMDVYENMSYHNLLLFYKGEITESELLGEATGVTTANNAVAYGLGNWYYCNNDHERAAEIFTGLINNGIWAAFGTIAAEADLHRMQLNSK